MDSRRFQRQVNDADSSDADREQLARKISSRPTTKTVRMGEPDSETQVVDKKFFAFMVADGSLLYSQEPTHWTFFNVNC